MHWWIISKLQRFISVIGLHIERISTFQKNQSVLWMHPAYDSDSSTSLRHILHSIEIHACCVLLPLSPNIPDLSSKTFVWRGNPVTLKRRGMQSATAEQLFGFPCNFATQSIVQNLWSYKLKLFWRRWKASFGAFVAFLCSFYYTDSR